MNPILQDLLRDFDDKVYHATDHYISMCQSAELERHRCSLAAATKLLEIAAIATHSDLSQEAFAQLAFNAFATASARIRNYAELERQSQKGAAK